MSSPIRPSYVPLGAPVLSPLTSTADYSQEPPSPSSAPSCRQRSDTVLTTSSRSSEIIQTPRSPSILGVLTTSPSSFTPHGQWHDRRRSSYGFIPSPSKPSAQTSGDDGSPLVFPLDPLNHNHSTGSLRIQAETHQEQVLTTLSAGTMVFPDGLFPEIPAASSTTFPDTPPPEDIDGAAAAEPERSRSKIKESVRRGLARSRSSLKSLSMSRTPEASTVEVFAGDADDGEPDERQELTTRKKRLRSFISRSLSRSGSSTSIGPAGLISAVPDASQHPPGSTPHEPESRLGSSSLDYFAPEPELLETAPRSPKTQRRVVNTIPPRVCASRPPMSASPSTYTSTAISPISPSPAILAYNRSLSMPITSREELHALSVPPRKVDYFGTMLPRELRLLVLRSLLQIWKDDDRDRRWPGELAGRRELVRFSRVSKAWRSLCFDGQLWPHLHLNAFAGYLHQNTLNAIFASTQTFMVTLNARGMDLLRLFDSVRTIPNLRHLDLRGCKSVRESEIIKILSRAYNLRTVNLRGLPAVGKDTLAFLPMLYLLESLDLSRCRNVGDIEDIAEYLRNIPPDQAARLKILKVAGLSGIGGGASQFLRLVGRRLINLEVLDMNGCESFWEHDWKAWRKELDYRKATSRLTHLNVSSNFTLSREVLQHLTGVLPLMQKLEMAFIRDLLRPTSIRGWPEPWPGDPDPNGGLLLVRLLKTMPKLTKLDLEETGLEGGIDDKVLAALTPGSGRRGACEPPEQVGTHLVELKLGHARLLTPEALVRLVKMCKKLQVLELDNTSADITVLREFYRHMTPTSSISMIDCLEISPLQYGEYAALTRPRAGFIGLAAAPFNYDEGEAREDRGVLKAFWGWKRVPPLSVGWREARREVEEEYKGNKRPERKVGRFGGLRREGRRRSRRDSWWSDDEDGDGRGCVVM